MREIPSKISPLALKTRSESFKNTKCISNRCIVLKYESESVKNQLEHWKTIQIFGDWKTNWQIL